MRKFCEYHEFYCCDNYLQKRILCSDSPIFEVLLCRFSISRKFRFFSGIKLKRNFLEKNENLSHFSQTKCENEAEWLPKNILFVKQFFLSAGNPSYTKLIITKVEQTIGNEVEPYRFYLVLNKLHEKISFGK